MKTIKNIIFDYGNVIFMIDFLKAQHAFEQLGIQNPADLFAHRGQAHFFDEFEKGKISPMEFRNQIRTVAGNFALTDTQIDQAWNSLLIGIPDGYLDALSKLKERYRTFLLSNNNEIHYHAILDYLNVRFNLKDNSSFFEKDYYSHLMGMRKPDKEIFEFVVDFHGLNPEETLFVDDSSQHIATATNLGFKTQLISSDDNLVSFLERESYLG
jgi:FMN phosphatase YigB (HAD superfamily)